MYHAFICLIASIEPQETFDCASGGGSYDNSYSSGGGGYGGGGGGGYGGGYGGNRR